VFENVFGHDRQKDIMARMIARDRLNQGLCFHGPDGVGKRLLAREVAKAMLCETRTGCGECAHCRKFAHAAHPDFLEVGPEGADIKVDQIRTIAENLHYRPFEGRARMIVLDQAERLREEAANAFLKSLEEPPDYVFFILVCADLKALLPTIRSRCQKIGFQSLKLEDKAKILETRFGKSPDMARKLASISFRRLETEDQAWRVFEKDLALCLEFIRMMLDEGHALDLLADMVRDREGFPRFLDHLTAAVRELALLSLGLESQPLFLDSRAALAELAARRQPEHWREMWARLLWLNGQRRRNLNHPLWFNAESVAGLGMLEDAAQQLKRRLRRGA